MKSLDENYKDSVLKKYGMNNVINAMNSIFNLNGDSIDYVLHRRTIKESLKEDFEAVTNDFNKAFNKAKKTDN